MDATITVDDERTIEPFYYDDELFGEWEHHSNGWSAPDGHSAQQRYDKHNSTDKNRFHLRVKNGGITVCVSVGPESQHVTIGRTPGDPDTKNKMRIPVPYAPYLVFMAVLRDPEQFLQKT